MEKVSPHTLVANWNAIPERPPWAYLTSMELSKVLGKHLQTINNWRIRGILPQPEAKNRKLRGNKNYFRIGAIHAWLESRSELEIVRDWLKHEMGADTLTDGQVNYLLHSVYKVSGNFS